LDVTFCWLNTSTYRALTMCYSSASK